MNKIFTHSKLFNLIFETIQEGKRPEYHMQSLEDCEKVALFGYGNSQMWYV